MNNLSALFSNLALQSAILGWFFAQVLKGLLNILIHRKFDAGRFIGMGGMPSSHSAFVTALATAIGILEGMDSAAFALAIGFAMVVMVDAAGVRRAAGMQARALNQIIDHLKHGGMAAVTSKELKVFLGHTPVEVIAGAILGILIGIIRTT